MGGPAARLDGRDLKLGPAPNRQALEGPLLHISGDLLVSGIHQHVHRADAAPAIDAQIDLIGESTDSAAQVLVLQTLHLGVDDLVDVVRDQALSEQVRAAQGDCHGKRNQQRVGHG